MSEELVQRAEDDPAFAFEEMAKRIRHNAGETFAGAVVVVPPEGEHITFLVLDSAKDLAQFWSSIKTRVELRMIELQDVSRAQRTFGR